MLYNNELARQRLVSQGGIVDDLLAGTLAESLQITQEAYFKNAENHWSLADSGFPTSIQNRGMELDSQEDLPHYPYRDDGLLLWQAIADYVKDYLGIYYPTVEDIQGDYELQAWAQELTAQGPDGGKVKGMASKIDTIEQLNAIVTTLIFTCGPQHSAVNFTQYDYMGFIPNAPLAAYQPIQTQFDPHRDLTLAELMAFLPPAKQVMGQIQILYALSDYRYDQLGYYDQNFGDRRANIALARFRQALNVIEQKIKQRNKNRVIPYEVLRPSLVLNSISI
jgi:arachidonate 15-lipoxygenase